MAVEKIIVRENVDVYHVYNSTDKPTIQEYNLNPGDKCFVQSTHELFEWSGAAWEKGAVGGGGEDTPEQVKQKYESNPDTNAFTDAEKITVSNNSTNINTITQEIGSLSTDVSNNTAEIAKKVDKVTGKGLSTNDFTDLQKSKLDNLNLQTVTDLGNRTDNPIESGVADKYAAISGGGATGTPGLLIRNNGKLADILFDEANNRIVTNHPLANGHYVAPVNEADYVMKKYIDDVNPVIKAAVRCTDIVHHSWTTLDQWQDVHLDNGGKGAVTILRGTWDPDWIKSVEFKIPEAGIYKVEWGLNVLMPESSVLHIQININDVAYSPISYALVTADNYDDNNNPFEAAGFWQSIKTLAKDDLVRMKINLKQNNGSNVSNVDIRRMTFMVEKI